MEITIKPHHFMDIIKLYGSGIEVFVPDEKMNHDFYKIANLILKHHGILLNLTIEADDICAPCIMCSGHTCTDQLHSIPDFDSKDAYNHLLDSRIMEQFQLDGKKKYETDYLCSVMLKHYDCIDTIWQEEKDEITQKRKKLFIKGAEKYLSMTDGSNIEG